MVPTVKKTWALIGKTPILKVAGGWTKISRKPENWGPAFLSSALLNLKKPKGQSSADMAEVLEVAKRDKEFIHRELEIVKPNIVVCCGTSTVAMEIIPGLKELKPIDPDGKCVRLNNTVWIDFCHFSAPWRHDIMYYGLQSIYRGAENNVAPWPQDKTSARALEI